MASASEILMGLEVSAERAHAMAFVGCLCEGGLDAARTGPYLAQLTELCETVLLGIKQLNAALSKEGLR